MEYIEKKGHVHYLCLKLRKIKGLIKEKKLLKKIKDN